MIRVTPDISIDENDLGWQFVRASGPGGQHVNKTSSAVQLRFDVAGSDLPAPVKRRLGTLAGKKMTENGELLIDSRNSRSQDANRKEALARLTDLIRRAAVKPKPRRKTKPTRASVRRRLDKKRRRSEIKKLRKKVRRDRP